MDEFERLIPNVRALFFTKRYKYGHQTRKWISKCVLLASQAQKIVITFSFRQLLLKRYQVNSLQICETGS